MPKGILDFPGGSNQFASNNVINMIAPKHLPLSQAHPVFTIPSSATAANP